jgi:threonine/homoserine/homoserine lactone efflux protein
MVMIDPTTLLLFSAASFLLAITPGPDLLYIATRSLTQGKRAGVVSAMGVHTGVLVHTLAAALGLSALVATSALAFSIVKYLGAAYLVYLGIRTLLSKEETLKIEMGERKNLSSIYYQGIITNVLNPKAILFFLAFLPQFVHPEKGSVPLQILFLGMWFIVVNFPVDAGVGLLGGTIGKWLRRKSGVQKASKWVTGTVFIGLGIGTALTSRGKS